MYIYKHIWNYICDDISIDVSFSLFKQSRKHLLLSERFKFQYWNDILHVFNMTYDLNYIIYISTGI